MAISREPWTKYSAADYKDGAAYCDACLVCDAPPGTPRDKLTKSNGHLPVYEPGSHDLNVNALHAAAARLAGAGGGVSSLTPALRKKAASRLVSLYREAKMTPPGSIISLAG